MSTYRTSKNANNPYVMLDKRFLEDDRLSWRAKGILSYLLSKPDDWQTREVDLVKRSREGREAVRSAMRELEACGYMRREQKRSGGGSFAENVYAIFELPEEPLPEKPSTVNPSTGKPSTVNPPHSNNDSTKNDLTKERESKPSADADTLEVVSKPHPKHSPPSEYADLYGAWNQHRGGLPETVNNANVNKALKAALKNYARPDLLVLITQGTQEVARDSFWLEHRYGLENLLRKLDSKAEAFRARGNASPKDQKVHERRQQFRIAMGAADA